MRILLCGICYCPEGYENPLLLMCHKKGKSGESPHLAHKPCLELIYQRGIRLCPSGDEQELWLESIFSEKEIREIKARSFCKWAKEEILSPLAYISLLKVVNAIERSAYTDRYLKQAEIARQERNGWKKDFRKRPINKETILNDVAIIAFADNIAAQQKKGYRVAAKIALAVVVLCALKHNGIL